MDAYTIQQTNLNHLQYDTLSLKRKVLSKVLHHHYAMAIWQLPFDDVQYCIVDFEGASQKIHLDLEESARGFAVSPFINPNLKETQFIKADFQINFQGETCSIKDDISGDTLKRERFFEGLESENTQNLLDIFRKSLKVSPTQNSSTHQVQYEQLVQSGVAHIQSGDFLKVVLSRTKQLAYESNFDLITLFQNLSKAYPSAFRYFFHIPKVGTWMGASPETLISVDSQQIFRTMALAGTQAFQPGKKLSEVAWTQKEIEEQAIVGRYIINCFKKIRLREFDEEGPKTVVAGNLMHLCTRYQVDMKACNFPQLGTVMLNLLHPTSAVCGMPKQSALDFIQSHETYHREFYSGFLGPVNINKESHIFVNLRCMQFMQDHMLLYAGAGITEDSVPMKEWKETEMKCETLAGIIQSL